MSQSKTRSSSEISKTIEEILDRKLEKLATKKDLDEIKNLFQNLNDKIELQDARITSLEEDSVNHENRISKLENELLILKDKNAVLNNSVDFLAKQNDAQEQYSRRSCLRINGIRRSANESSSDCVEKILKVCKDMNINLEASDIDRAHRVGKERKTMIVKFYSFNKRTSVYKARKSAKNNIKVHLDLTKARLRLLDGAKELITPNSNVDFVFADVNCNVVAKLKNDDYKFFDTIASFKDRILQS